MDDALAGELWSATGYREFLRDWFDARKRDQSSYSLAVMGKRLAVDPSLLSRILQGERHLATSRIQPVCDMLGLENDAAEYFRCLVLHAKSKTAREAQAQFERMQALRRIAPVPLSDAHATYWDSWIHVALRSLLSCGDFKDEWQRMGELLHPRQKAAAVRKAMGTLAQLGMVGKDASGHWRLTDPFVKDGAGTPVRALRNFHRQGLLLAIEAIEGLSPSKRHVASSTVAIDAGEYAQLVRQVDDLLLNALTRASRVEHPDRVIQLAVQLVPVAGTGLRDASGTV
jgi:uncharacterized protein (TIGR02147 family)